MAKLSVAKTCKVETAEVSTPREFEIILEDIIESFEAGTGGIDADGQRMLKISRDKAKEILESLKGIDQQSFAEQYNTYDYDATLSSFIQMFNQILDHSRKDEEYIMLFIDFD